MKAEPTTQALIEMLYERIPELFDRPKREWVGLTDRETADCFEAKVISDRLKADAKRIETKLKEKNT
jgi:hypothetical protein